MFLDITEEEIKKVCESYIVATNPLKIKELPSKERRKYILLTFIIKEFQNDKRYSEKEVNEMLKPISSEYAMIRRYLVDYKFLSRTPDGREYWVNENK